MRKLFVVGAAIILFALLTSPAVGDPGGNGKGKGGGQPSTATSSIALEEYSDLRLGGSVGFTTNAAGLAGWEYPMVAVWCYQDGLTVYMQLGQPHAEFTLGGGSSDWLVNGGPADCEAILYAFGWKGNEESVRELAETSFWAAG